MSTQAQPTPPDIKTIGTDRYIAAPLPASKALRLLTRITKTVGNTVITIAAKGRAGLDDISEEENLSPMLFAVRMMLDRLEEAEVELTILELLSTVHVAGSDKTVDKIFDEHFKGRMWHLLQVVQYAMETNYKDFFDALRSHDIGALTKGTAASAA